MTAPGYLETFKRAVREQEERAARERGGGEISELSEISPPLNSLTSLISHLPAPEPHPFARVLDARERRLPDYVAPERWQQCLLDARYFLLAWGDQAQALGWTAAELFGLHKPPANPHPSYCRLSRYDHTGLIWHLTGSRVVALTDDTAAIESRTTGNVLIYRKARKPA
jgi:hypothetical protein